MEAVPEFWRLESLTTRLARYNVSTRSRSYVQRLPTDADLRAVRVPGLDLYHPSHGAILAEHLFAPGYSFLEPFVRGVPLGPLAAAQVYSSNAYEKWVGKAHAPGHCQHNRGPRDDDDLISAAEWLDVHEGMRERGWFDSPLCSKCGGFAVRLLDADQCRYFGVARELSDCIETLEYYERPHNDRVWPGNSSATHYDRGISEVGKMRVRVEAVGVANPPLATCASALSERATVVINRYTMRRDNTRST